MKRIATLFMAVSLLITFYGCANEPTAVTTEPTQTQSAATQTTQSTVPTQSVALPQLPMLAFSAPVQTIEHYADDGTLLFSYSYQDISLILEDPQIADTIMLDLLNHVDYENSAAKRIRSDAEAAYNGQDDWIPFSYSTFFSPERFDLGILSLCGVHTLFNGSPRSTSATVSITYDLLSGRQLGLKDVLVADYSADALCQLIIAALEPIAEQGLLFSDYAYAVSDMFATNRPVDSWYLSQTGLCFYFAPYEIAPYSSGTISAEVPYDALAGLLKDEYFPEEAENASGTAQILPFADAPVENIIQFAELVIDENAEQYLLCTQGHMQDVRIASVSWPDDGQYVIQATVFAATDLLPDEGIMIQVTADSAQTLLLTYRSGGETVSVDLWSAIGGN